MSTGRGRTYLQQLKRVWPILVPSAIMYFMVTCLPRYTPGFMLAGLCAIVASMRASNNENSIRILSSAVSGVALSGAYPASQSMRQNYHDSEFWPLDVEAARQLRSMGLKQIFCHCGADKVDEYRFSGGKTNMKAEVSLYTRRRLLYEFVEIACPDNSGEEGTSRDLPLEDCGWLGRKELRALSY